LTIGTSPDFGAKWLVHRLGRFAAARPKIDLRVATTTKQVDLVAEHVDVAIRHGDGHWSGLDAVALCQERLVAVCSPKLLCGRKRITKASDLLEHPLLRLDGWSTWSRWFDAAGLSVSPQRGPVLNQASMLIDAAIDGQGIALARTSLAAWDLLHGREPKIVMFRDWLLAEAADDARRLRALWDSAEREPSRKTIRSA
jgi:LysR family glycine cleavage system transcriptional activator